MKRFLSAGEGYALFPTNINYRVPRYFLAWRALLLFVFSFFMCLEFSMAQEKQVPFDKNKYEIPSGGVVIGEKVPEWFWELGFDVVNTLGGHKTIRLKDYRHKLLVIDFWASWCKPCVESVDKWEVLHQDFRNEVGVLAVHAFDFEEKARPFAEKRGWTLPVVVGPADSLINRLFYTKYRFGQVWIKDDKLIAIPLSKSVTRDNVIRVIRSLPHEIKMNSNLTHFDPRYELGKGGDDDAR